MPHTKVDMTWTSDENMGTIAIIPHAVWYKYLWEHCYDTHAIWYRYHWNNRSPGAPSRLYASRKRSTNATFVLFETNTSQSIHRRVQTRRWGHMTRTKLYKFSALDWEVNYHGTFSTNSPCCEGYPKCPLFNNRSPGAPSRLSASRKRSTNATSVLFEKKTPVEVFTEECKPEDQIFIISDLPGLIPAWIGIILPLQVDAENVYALAFIVDIGAPRFFYLGRRCVEVLRDERVIIEVGDNEMHDYTLKGYIRYQHWSISRVYTDVLPIHYEPKPEDICANVIGLSSLWSFNIWNICDLPCLWWE